MNETVKFNIEYINRSIEVGLEDSYSDDNYNFIINEEIRELEEDLEDGRITKEEIKEIKKGIKKFSEFVNYDND